MHHRPVQPCRPPAPYVGGKRNLARRLAQRIEAVDHAIYAEPFVGMGGVFLARRYAAHTELINDRSRDVTNLFRILQRQLDAFMGMLRFQLTSRTDFDRLMKVDPSTCTDIERAVRFLYLQRTAFGGKVAGRTFGISLDARGGRFDVTRLVEVLDAVHQRLAGVIIENLDYADFIGRYDRADALFYLDPPYFGTEHYYGLGLFTAADFGRLAAILANLSGSFILSVNDAPEMRACFAAFDVEAVDVNYGISLEGSTRARELIVSCVKRHREKKLF